MKGIVAKVYCEVWSLFISYPDLFFVILYLTNKDYEHQRIYFQQNSAPEED